MKSTLTRNLVIACLILCAHSSRAADNLNDAEKARISGQVNSLRNAKIQSGQNASASTSKGAQSKIQAIDKQHAADKEYVNKKTEEWSYVIGPDAAKAVGAAHHRQLTEAAEAQKSQVRAEADRKAAAQKAAANKNADNVNASIQGLKSQVSKDGKFGVQPQHSNLYVRHYGK